MRDNWLCILCQWGQFKAIPTLILACTGADEKDPTAAVPNHSAIVASAVTNAAEADASETSAQTNSTSSFSVQIQRARDGSVFQYSIVARGTR